MRWKPKKVLLALINNNNNLNRNVKQKRLQKPEHYFYAALQHFR